MANLALQKTPAVAAQIKSLDAALREQVDYPAVTMDVAQYNIDMARWWMESTPGWAAVVNGTWAVTGNRTVPSSKKGSGQLNADWGELRQTVALTGHGASTETYWASPMAAPACARIVAAHEARFNDRVEATLICVGLWFLACATVGKWSLNYLVRMKGAEDGAVPARHDSAEDFCRLNASCCT